MRFAMSMQLVLGLLLFWIYGGGESKRTRFSVCVCVCVCVCVYVDMIGMAQSSVLSGRGCIKWDRYVGGFLGAIWLSVLIIFDNSIPQDS
jgi:hypothetical protein